jgi:LPS-assembly protein
VGRVDYSLRSGSSSTIANTTEEPRVTQAIAGLEYKGDCCWVGRVVYQRYAVSAADTNSAVFLQLELTGLGSLGTDPMNLLNRSIPGYSRITPPVPTGTTFERYE